MNALPLNPLGPSHLNAPASTGWALDPPPDFLGGANQFRHRADEGAKVPQQPLTSGFLVHAESFSNLTRSPHPRLFPCASFCLCLLLPFAFASAKKTRCSSLCRSINEEIMMAIGMGRTRPLSLFLALAFCFVLLSAGVEASVGDQLKGFRECVKVRHFYSATG